MRRLLTLIALVMATRAVAGDIPGEIAFVGTDHQVYVVNPNGGEPRPLTRGEAGHLAAAPPLRRSALNVDDSPSNTEQRYAWPTWSPDGKSLLVQGTRITGEGITQKTGVYTVRLDHPGAIRPLYEDLRRAPIYVYWAPTGGRAAVLVTDPQGLSLSVLDADKSTELRPLAVGLPFYLAWRDDGKALVTHVGGAREEDHGAEVSLIDIGKAGKDPKSATQRVTDQPAAFRAPGWSPDGSQFAYAAWRGEKRSASLFLKPRSGAEGRELARVSGRLVFSWAPDGEALAVAEAGSPEAPFFAGINLVAVTDGHRDPVFAGPLGAFFWAPDGRRLMIAAPEFDSGEWAWIVVERNTRQAREVMRFLPSPDFQMLILHFDQYALSHRLWAPDSRHFVFAAYRANRTAEAGPVPPAVWMIDTTTAKVHQLAEGRSAFWSPR